MGVGKTSVCKLLIKKLPNSIILGGDECWNANRDYANPEAQKKVLKEIVKRLNSYIKDDKIQNIFFTWVMHKKEIIDAITNDLIKENLKIINISLIADKNSLISRLNKDINAKIRDESVISRSLERLEHFNDLNTIKINTSNKSLEEIAEEIINQDSQ